MSTRKTPVGSTRWAVTILLALLVPRAVDAQTNLQLWGNLTLNWITSERVTYELDLEPKVLLTVPAGEPGWRNLDVTPSVEFAAKGWLDLTGEFTTGYTKQTDDDNSLELSSRMGARFHLLSRDVQRLGRPTIRHELPPKRRLIVRDYVRVEQRSFFYTGEEPSSFTWRFRNRLEFQFPLNRAKVTDDGARYLSADWEWFVPLGDPTERFASRQRIRAGLGVRRNRNWRFETVYMWTRSRDTTQDSFRTSDNIIDIRIKRVF